MELRNEVYIPFVSLKIVKEKEISYDTREIDNPQKVVVLVKELLDGADKEKMIVIPVDTKCRPVGVEIVAVGRLNQLASEPRDIFKYAIMSNAYGIILVHNHPSGNCEASMEDKTFTETMREAGKFLGIELIDHVIVGEENTYYSIRENEQWNK